MNLNCQDATHESAKEGLKGGYLTDFCFHNYAWWIDNGSICLSFFFNEISIFVFVFVFSMYLFKLLF